MTLTREQINNIVAHYDGMGASAFVEGLEVQDVRKLCDLALRGLEQPADHADMVLVPREPTEAMIKVMAACYDPTWGYPHGFGVETEWAAKSYRAMLAALSRGTGSGEK